MFKMPDDQYIRSKHKPRHYAATEQQLEQHHIEVGKATIKAKRDPNNHVYWVLPGSRTTYHKPTALAVAKNTNKLIGGH